MSKYTIIQKDNYVQVDDSVQIFDFKDLIDEDVMSVSWDTDISKGLLQTSLFEEDVLYETTEIDDFDHYDAIIDKFYSNEITAKSAKQHRLYRVFVIWLSGADEEVSIEYADSNDISYTEMPLPDAKEFKIEEIRDDVLLLTNELFNSVDTLAQIKTRTMLSYNWSSLNTKETLTPEEEEDLVLYNEVLNYLNVLDIDIIYNTNNINTLITTKEVMAYNIELTPIPPNLQDNSRRALNYLKLSSV